MREELTEEVIRLRKENPALKLSKALRQAKENLKTRNFHNEAFKEAD